MVNTYRCHVPSCRRKSEPGNVTLFAFPKNPEMRAKWLSNLSHIPNLREPKKCKRICSRHFSPQMLEPTANRWFRYKQMAVPELHLGKTTASKILPISAVVEEDNCDWSSEVATEGEGSNEEGHSSLNGDRMFEVGNISFTKRLKEDSAYHRMQESGFVRPAVEQQSQNGSAHDEPSKNGFVCCVGVPIGFSMPDIQSDGTPCARIVESSRRIVIPLELGISPLNVKGIIVETSPGKLETLPLVELPAFDSGCATGDFDVEVNDAGKQSVEMDEVLNAEGPISPMEPCVKASDFQATQTVPGDEAGDVCTTLNVTGNAQPEPVGMTDISEVEQPSSPSEACVKQEAVAETEDAESSVFEPGPSTKKSRWDFKCIVPGCGYRPDGFPVPLFPKARKKWLGVLREIPDFDEHDLGPNPKICPHHFQPHDLIAKHSTPATPDLKDLRGRSRLTLSPAALPELNLLMPKKLKPESPELDVEQEAHERKIPRKRGWSRKASVEVADSANTSNREIIRKRGRPRKVPVNPENGNTCFSNENDKSNVTAFPGELRTHECVSSEERNAVDRAMSEVGEGNSSVVLSEPETPERVPVKDDDGTNDGVNSSVVFELPERHERIPVEDIDEAALLTFNGTRFEVCYASDEDGEADEAAVEVAVEDDASGCGSPDGAMDEDDVEVDENEEMDASEEEAPALDGSIEYEVFDENWEQ